MPEVGAGVREQAELLIIFLPLHFVPFGTGRALTETDGRLE